MAGENHINLPADKEVAGKVVDSQAQQAMRKIDRGGLGWIFGTRDHVPNNVAATVVAVTLVSIVYLVMNGGWATETKDKISVLSPLLTLFGGYLFGKNAKD